MDKTAEFFRQHKSYLILLFLGGLIGAFVGIYLRMSHPAISFQKQKIALNKQELALQKQELALQSQEVLLQAYGIKVPGQPQIINEQNVLTNDTSQESSQGKTGINVENGIKIPPCKCPSEPICEYGKIQTGNAKVSGKNCKTIICPVYDCKKLPVTSCKCPADPVCEYGKVQTGSKEETGKNCKPVTCPTYTCKSKPEQTRIDIRKYILKFQHLQKLNQQQIDNISILKAQSELEPAPNNSIASNETAILKSSVDILVEVRKLLTEARQLLTEVRNLLAQAETPKKESPWTNPYITAFIGVFIANIANSLYKFITQLLQRSVE